MGGRRIDWLSIKSSDWSGIDLSYGESLNLDELPTVDFKELFHWAKKEFEKGVVVPQKLPIEQGDLILLAEKYIEWYKRLVDAALEGKAGIRIDECRYYLAVWERILGKGGMYTRLNLEEQSEVLDAIEDEKCG